MDDWLLDLDRFELTAEAVAAGEATLAAVGLDDGDVAFVIVVVVLIVHIFSILLLLLLLLTVGLSGELGVVIVFTLLLFLLLCDDVDEQVDVEDDE